MTRRDAREQALLLVFELAFTDDPVSELAQTAALCRGVEIDEYALLAARRVQEHFLEIDAIITRFSTKWKLGRLSKVAVAILRLAICELSFMEGVPQGAVINEAVELAKKYGGDEDPAFINGVLGGYVRQGQTKDRIPGDGIKEE